MSHGDLKPANTLVFRNGTSDTYAKVADFGYAGWAIGNTENNVVYPPRSWPWNAPEHHHRGFAVPAAKKLDVYSFGLICLWLLFFDKSSLVDPGANHKDGSQWPLENFNILDRMKHEDTLKDFACFQVSSVQMLCATQKAALVRFFLSAIVCDPEKRATNLQELIKLLGHSWYVICFVEIFACLFRSHGFRREPGPISLDAEQKEIDHTQIEFEVSTVLDPFL